MFTKNDSLLASNFINLSKNEQDEMILIIRGKNKKQAETAKELLISRLQPLIDSEISSYNSYRVSDDVLSKISKKGILKALETYNTSKKYRFSVYASWFIRAEIHKFLGLPIDPEKV